MKKLLAIFLSIGLFLPGLAFAAETAQKNVIITADDIVDHNYYNAANSIAIDGTVNGDVIVVAETIIVNGDVAGDVIAAGKTIKIAGTVAGNVRAAGSSIDITGAVGKNANLFASDITIDSDATIGWSLMTGAATTDIGGTVSGNIDAYGGDVTLSGTAKNDITVSLDDMSILTVGADARVAGDLKYTGKTTATIHSDAVVVGATTHTLPSQTTTKAKDLLHTWWLYWQLISLLGLLFVGIIAISLFPALLHKLNRTIRERTAGVAVSGMLAFLLTPLAVIILFMTIIGIPLALILGTLYVLALYISKIVIGIYIGTFLVNKMRKTASPSLFWPLMLGTTIVFVLTSIPVVGWLLGIVAAVWGMGAIIDTMRPHTAQ
ncbi:MAG: polymer-forming cytoskeletal protein [Patescibacteria group bacterium]|jgi:cytoskeletal protein CcmA (bactofilin family)